MVKTADRGWGLKANQPIKKVCIDMNALCVTAGTNELWLNNPDGGGGFMQYNLQKVAFMVFETT